MSAIDLNRSAASSSFRQRHPGPGAHPHPKYLYWPLFLSPFGALHLAAIVGPMWAGVTRQAVVCCIVLYVVRMFGMSAGYHRYFSHRTFKTGRVGQFVLAWLAQSTAQKGVIWWAAHHREHHKYADLPGDVHSPVRDGFLYAHMGWISNDADATDFSRVQDLAKFPELMFLNRFWYLPPAVLGVATTYLMGLPGLFVGFCLSTVLVFHGTFFVNSLAHVWGSRRYLTTDGSRNSAWLSLITLGEGWHNNHHQYMGSAKQGFFWWEFDPTYYTLKVLSWLRLVWDLRLPPPAVVRATAAAALATPAATPVATRG